jgi:hypothetical protein
MPSLADGRDLLDDIILKKWTPTLTLFEIVQMIPIFVVSLIYFKYNFIFLIQFRVTF